MMSWNYRILELDDIDEGKYYEQFEDVHIFRKSEHFAANQQNKKKHISSYL